eukprot:PhM_4_TR10256/c0_g1_i1/m.18252
MDANARVDRMRKLQRQRIMQEEQQREDTLININIEQRRRQRMLDRQAVIADELEKRVTEEMRKDKMVQLVRQQAPELRELESKLQIAYMNKEREAQLAEKSYIKEQQKVNDKDVFEKMREQWRKEDEVVIEQQQKRTFELRKQKDVIEQQLREREQQQLEALQQFLREKEQVDAIVSKIQEEDFKAALSKMDKMRQNKEELETFMSQRIHLLEAEHQRKEAEDAAIREYYAQEAQKKQASEARKQKIEEEKRKLLEEQSRRIMEDRRRKEEMDELLAEYHNELVQAREREKLEQERQRKAADRTAMMAANEQQKRLKDQMRQKELEEEVEFRRKMMEKFAEDDRIDKMEAARRSRMKAEHTRRVNELIEEKRRLREEALQREKDEEAAAAAREAERQRIISEERRRLILQHAIALGGYLPKGIVKDEAEMDLLVQAGVVQRSPPPSATTGVKKF